MMDPSQKRLAMPSKDLPLEFSSFEGVTAKGRAVLLWDSGTFEHTTKHKNFTPSFEKALNSGHLQIKLNGSKLKGEFILRRIKRGATQWLLLKKSDGEGVISDLELMNKSVKTSKTFKDLTEGV